MDAPELGNLLLQKILKSLYFFIALGVASVVYAVDGPHLECHVVVPQEYYKDLSFRPNGDPEPVRYTEAYEAFWWNCVAVKAADMNAHCPIEPSGTPAAVQGGGDGAIAAMNGIHDQVAQFGATAVQAYLKKIATPEMIKAKFHGYFDGKPSPETP